MTPLVWGSEYELGIPEMDDQHRRLLTLVNEAVAAVEKREEHRLEPVMNDLFGYAKQHFAEEEARMVTARFPKMEAHLREHHGFQLRITELYSRFLEGDPHTGRELCAFLQAWLVAHIQGSDRHYVSYFLEAAGLEGE